MKKRAFKTMCIVMSAIILFCSVLMVFIVRNTPVFKAFDVFGCNEVIEDIKNYEMNMTSVIYTQNTKGEWEEYQRLHGTENRIWISIDNVPKPLLDAIVSIEDQRFYDHMGVDWKRTISAFANLYLHFWSSEQGGSTITQQLIKNVTSDNDKSKGRKVRESVRAIAVEKDLSKKEILEAYINTISLGNGICGVQVASNYYFNKDVSELTLLECAALAGITKNPSLYNPISHPEENLNRRRSVLKKMYELGKIDVDSYNDAYEAELTVDLSQKNEFETQINSYFVDTLINNVSENLAEKLGCTVEEATKKLYNGGYKIYSSVDLSIQKIMDEVYLNVPKYFSQRSKFDGSKTVQSAMTIMDYSGHIVGIVGGVGEKTVNRGLNRATDSPRQPGSTMKPIGVYTPAIDCGAASPTTVIEDKPIKNYFGKGKDGPNEWYGYYAGKMTIQKALERSANTIPCWILKDDLGIDASYQFLTEKLQLKHLTEADKNIASLALGGCQYGITTTESAAAYAIFGNQGKFFKPVTYYKVTDKNGESILTDDKDGEQVIHPGTAAAMNNLLQNVVYGSQGTGRGIAGYSKMKVYAKTGTSSESNDLWMVAGTPYYVGSVWYGFDKNENIYNQSAAATVWRAVMTSVHKNLDNKDLNISDDLEKKTYCKYTGLLAGKKCGSVGTGYYVPGVKLKYCDGKHGGGLPDQHNSSSSSAESSSASVPSSSSSSVPTPPADTSSTASTTTSSQ